MDAAYREAIGIQLQTTALQDCQTVAESLTLFATLYDKAADCAELAAPTPGTALPAGLRLAQWVLGGLMAAMGAALFVAPASAEQRWPWSLTPLTAHMVGSFYLAIGVSLFAAARENDYARIRVASFAYLVFAVLRLVRPFPTRSWTGRPCRG